MKHQNESEKLGKRILLAAKNEIYFDQPYLSYAIGSLGEKADLSMPTIGTDGELVRFRPIYLFETYLNRPLELNRIYIHILLHNLLFHPFSGREHIFRYKNMLPKRDENDYPIEDYLSELWDLSCDICAEAVADSMNVQSLRMVESDFRNEWYKKLSDRLHAFTAQRLFKYFIENPPNGSELVRLEKEFKRDDHRFWEKLNDDEKEAAPPDINYAPMTNLPLKEVWEKAAKAVESELEHTGSVGTDESGRLSWNLKLVHLKRRDYKSLLSKYMVYREVASIDTDAFDVAYYQYGMQRYGNMPLIEELEGREERRIETLVVAIDTSASTKKSQVVRFLSETISFLRKREYFFKNAGIRIIECDDRIQKDTIINGVEDLSKYKDSFEVHGGYGTDYRPVFSYIAKLKKEGKLSGLKGLLYFTDGYGIYPAKVSDYETSFVFARGEDFDDTKVPDWAIRVYV